MERNASFRYAIGRMAQRLSMVDERVAAVRAVAALGVLVSCTLTAGGCVEQRLFPIELFEVSMCVQSPSGGPVANAKVVPGDDRHKAHSDYEKLTDVAGHATVMLPYGGDRFGFLWLGGVYYPKRVRLAIVAEGHAQEVVVYDREQFLAEKRTPICTVFRLHDTVTLTEEPSKR